MRAIIVGAVESTRVAIRAVARARDWEVAAVVTLPPSLASRHSDFVDLATDAETAGAKLIHAPNGNAREIIDAVRALAPDYLFVIGWSQICKPEFLGICPDRAIGYHPAALPRMRGRGVTPWTILNDEKITAGSLFWIDGGVDTGDILAQHYFHVAPDETVGSLYDRHMAALERMLDESMPPLATGKARRDRQDERFATWCARRTAEDGLIDWNRPAAEVWRLIRAVGRPYPGAFTHDGGEKLVVWGAEPWQGGEAHVASAGQVIALEDAGFVVRCGDGQALRVTDWEGAKPRNHVRLGHIS